MIGYADCSRFDQYVEFLMVFAGEPDLLREFIEHRSACPTCKNNTLIFRDWLRVKAMNTENKTNVKSINQLASYIKDWPEEYKRQAGAIIRDAVVDVAAFQGNWKQIILDANQAIAAIEAEMSEEKIDENENLPEM